MITDLMLNNLAKAFSGEAYVVPAYAGFTSTVLTPAATHTSTQFAGEFTRVSATASRSGATITLSAIKTGATLGSSSQAINTVGLFNVATSGELLAEAIVPSLVHTSSFDVELDWRLSFERK